MLPTELLMCGRTAVSAVEIEVFNPAVEVDDALAGSLVSAVPESAYTVVVRLVVACMLTSNCRDCD